MNEGEELAALEIAQVAIDLARYFREDNPAFQEWKFLKAAGASRAEDDHL